MIQRQVAILFHGTSRESADAIVRNGFLPGDVDAHSHRIATRFGLDIASLAPPTSFLATRRKDEHVYATPNLMHAAHYATRSGELERLLLEQAYCLLCGEPASATDPVRDRWVRDQQPVHPAIVVLEVDLVELGSDAQARVLDHAERYDHSHPTMYTPDIELSVATANRSIVGVRDVDYCVCTPSAWDPKQCGRSYCQVCEKLRHELGLPSAAVEDFDPFICPGPWFRMDGRPAVAPNTLESADFK